MLFQMAIFSCVGVAMEVVFTSLYDFAERRDPRLKGSSYLWMFPLYALIPLFLSVLTPRLSGWPLAARLGLYVLILLAAEYSSGWLLRKALGTCPWEAGYRGKRWAIHGLTRLDYAPAWAAACFVWERLYLALLR